MSNREATRAGLVMWCNTRELVEREREKEPSRVLMAWRMMSIESNHTDSPTHRPTSTHTYTRDIIAINHHHQSSIIKRPRVTDSADDPSIHPSIHRTIHQLDDSRSLSLSLSLTLISFDVVTSSSASTPSLIDHQLEPRPTSHPLTLIYTHIHRQW